MVGFLYDSESQKFRVRKQACARLLMLLGEELERYINHCKAQKFFRFIEIFFGLAGKADDDIRRKAHAGYVFTARFDVFIKRFGVISAPHRRQNGGAAALYRKM